MGKMPDSPFNSSRLCEICQHPDRAEIERLMLSCTPGNPHLSLDTIAQSYGVSSQQLRIHALMHSPVALDFSEEAEESLVETFRDKAGVTSQLNEDESDDASSQPTPRGSSVSNNTRLADKIGMREGDMLGASAADLLVTMHTLGNRIKRFASDGSEGSDQRLVNFCTNAMVNLYLGTSAELRKTINDMAALNTAINGEENSAAKGLMDLVKAIHNSGGNNDDDKSYCEEVEE